MTTNSDNQERRSSQQNAYNPITFEDLPGPKESSSRDYFGELNDPLARWIAAPLLGFVFIFTLRMPVMGPLMVVVLLGCLLVRLDERPRQIAAVPLTMAAIKLAFQMAGRVTSTLLTAPYKRGDALDFSYIWLPVFFSACLIFIPKRDSVTFKIVLTGACLLIASGLLPGEGFVVIYYMLDGILFVAIVVGLIFDIKSNYQARPLADPHPAH